MSWNYRKVRTDLSGLCGQDGNETVGIHSVYYDEDGTPEYVTVSPLKLEAESEKELKQMVYRMQVALEKPTLNYENFTKKVGK
jgi:hypothetical protein